MWQKLYKIIKVLIKMRNKNLVNICCSPTMCLHAADYMKHMDVIFAQCLHIGQELSRK